MKKIFLLLLVALRFSIYSSISQSLNYDIRINQAGYLTNSIKYAAVINSSAENFEIKTSDLITTVYSGKLNNEVYYAASDENVKIADFSSVNIPGNYVVVVSDLGKSVTFKISQDLMVPVTKAAIKAFYFNRASTALLTENSGVYARAAGHPDTAVVVHASAASANRPAGTIISTPKGWYDAGDYNKYVVNSGISTFCLLSAYESYPEYYDTLELNIPESGNGIPDILDEAMWNISWMMTMQDSSDGGVYHKTTAASFESSIMPAACTSTRYVAAKGTAATLDFAAIMAISARVYKKYMPELAEKALNQSKAAWQWAKNNPNIPFTNPDAIGEYPHISTGEYGDNTFGDEFFWCAAELYITTKDTIYSDEMNIDTMNFDVPGWGNVRTLGLLSLLAHRDSLISDFDTDLLKNKLVELVKDDKNNTVTNPYKIPCEFYSWGGNSGYACTGMLLMQAFNLTGDAAYYNAAISALDYLLGRNATQYCFMTGVGTKRPMNIHHRISKADGITEPVPGFLVGGPSTTKLSDCGESLYPSLLPARAYLDMGCSYSSNEVAINWNAPLVYLLGAIQSEYLNHFKTAMPEYFIISDNNITFPYKSGYEYPLIIEGNGNWKLISNVDWISLSASTGTGNTNLNAVNTSDNTTESPRYGYIYVYNNDILIDSVYISQNGVRKNFIIQFEDYIEMTGLQTETTSDIGGGLNLGYVDVDDWVTYSIDISYEGVYNVNIRHAGMAGDFDVYIDDNLLQTVTLDATSDWQDWVTTSVKMELREGAHVMKIVFNKIGVNLNWMQYTWESEIQVNISSISNEWDISIYPVPADENLIIETHSKEEIKRIQLVSIDGKILLDQEYTESKLKKIDVSGINKGIYIVQVYIGTVTHRKTVIIR